MHLDKHEEHHKERPSDGMEANRASDSPPSEIARELSMEPKDVEHDDRLTLGDSHEGDGGEASDFRVSSETAGDDGLINSVNRQKFISRIEQSGDQDNGVGDDSRLTHSDNSRARSGTSRDFQKLHEIGEEVTQIRPLKHLGDLSKHREEDDLRQRDDHGRDGRREAGKNRSRERETMHESYSQKDSGSGHAFQGRSIDFEREMDGSVGAWHRREDDTHYRQVKDEDIRRGYNDEIRPREMSKTRMIDRKEKIEDHVKKRIDEGDWRGHGRDDGLRHRERNDSLMNRRDNLEDGQMKRKRGAELARRERADKEDTSHGYRVREDSHRKKRIRGDIVDHRKRDDDVRTKSKIDDRHSSKHKDDNWYQREREDRQQLNLAHDETPLALQGREERRFTSRSGRPMDKLFAVARRSKEDSKVAGSDKGYHDNDRRRHIEPSKRGDRTGEENESLNKVRGDTHTREKRFNAEQRSMRHDRPSGASDEHQVQKERHRDSIKKTENSESVGQKGGVSGKRKRSHNTHRTEVFLV